jgi:hypothetical protein
MVSGDGGSDIEEKSNYINVTEVDHNIYLPLVIKEDQSQASEGLTREKVNPSKSWVWKTHIPKSALGYLFLMTGVLALGVRLRRLE